MFFSFVTLVFGGQACLHGVGPFRALQCSLDFNSDLTRDVLLHGGPGSYAPAKVLCSDQLRLTDLPGFHVAEDEDGVPKLTLKDQRKHNVRVLAIHMAIQRAGLLQMPAPLTQHGSHHRFVLDRVETLRGVDAAAAGRGEGQSSAQRAELPSMKT